MGTRVPRDGGESAQLALEDLAGGVAGQVVDEHDLTRDLVAREVTADVVLEIALGEDDAGSRLTTARRRWPNSSSRTSHARWLPPWALSDHERAFGWRVWPRPSSSARIVRNGDD
jgi:hypothetical protein